MTSHSSRPPRVLFVCLGNICRSPLAEAILRRQAKEAGIDVGIDSAGTGNWHAGELADRRARAEGARRGCSMHMRARQLESEDFEFFDLIVVMDDSNYQEVIAWRGARPEKVRLARSFDPTATSLEVPDPYYGTRHDFTEVGEMLERACEGILRHLTEHSDLS